MKTNIISKVYTFFWLFMIYLGIIMFVQTTSHNISYKNKNIIHKVWAELNFYQSELNSEYERDLWSSRNFPLQTVYERLKVTLNGEPTPVPTAISTVNITRRSH